MDAPAVARQQCMDTHVQNISVVGSVVETWSDRQLQNAETGRHSVECTPPPRTPQCLFLFIIHQSTSRKRYTISPDKHNLKRIKRPCGLKMANAGQCHLRVAKTLLNTQNIQIYYVWNFKEFKTPMLLSQSHNVTVLNINIRLFQTLRKKSLRALITFWTFERSQRESTTVLSAHSSRANPSTTSNLSLPNFNNPSLLVHSLPPKYQMPTTSSISAHSENSLSCPADKQRQTNGGENGIPSKAEGNINSVAC